MTYTVTTGEGALFPGTRDVGLTVKVDARFDDDGVLKVTADGKPDFRVSFAF